MVETYNNNNKKGFTGILVVLVVLVLLGVGIFYGRNSGLFKSLLTGNNIAANGKNGRKNELVKTSSTYKVQSVTPDTITLAEKNGNFTLPNDPAKVSVYKGPTKESPKMALSDLKVGDNVNLEFVQGVSATLFVSQM